MALHHAPLVAITLWTGLRSVPQSLVEAAQMEGAAPSTRHRAYHRCRCCGRRSSPPALIAFVAGVGNFGIPALLGLPVNYLTLPTLIYRRLSSFGPSSLGETAALAVLVGDRRRRSASSRAPDVASAPARRRSRSSGRSSRSGCSARPGPSSPAACGLLLALKLGLPLLAAARARR